MGAGVVEVDAVVEEPIGVIAGEGVDIDEGEAVFIGGGADGAVHGVVAGGLNAEADHAGNSVKMRRGRGAENEAGLGGEGEVILHKGVVFAGEGIGAVPGGGVVGAEHENDDVRLGSKAGIVGGGFAVRIGAACHGGGAADAIIFNAVTVTQAFREKSGIAFGAIAGGVAVADAGDGLRVCGLYGCRWRRIVRSAAATGKRKQTKAGDEKRKTSHGKISLLKWANLYYITSAGAVRHRVVNDALTA